MAVTARNLIQGPMDVYIGTFDGTTVREPLLAAVNSTPQASAWSDAGGTDGGAQLLFNQSFSVLTVDQLIDPVESRLIGRDVQVKSNLAEATLANLKSALNGGAITTAAGGDTYDASSSSLSTQPNYIAVLLHGWAPSSVAGAAKRRMVICRKVLNIDAVQVDAKKDAKTMIPVTFRLHYVDGTTAPFRIYDEK